MSDKKYRLTEGLCCLASITNVGPSNLNVLGSCMVFQGSALRSEDMTSIIYCLLQNSPLEECGKHSTCFFTWVARGGQDVCHVMTSCFQDCLIKSLVAFSTGESLNEGLCSLPGLILCQSLWLWSASEPNPSLEGWLAAVGDSSKFLSRLYKTDFISFRLLLHWRFTQFSQWIFSVLALSPCGFYIHFRYQ